MDILLFSIRAREENSSSITIILQTFWYKIRNHQVKKTSLLQQSLVAVSNKVPIVLMRIYSCP